MRAGTLLLSLLLLSIICAAQPIAEKGSSLTQVNTIINSAGTIPVVIDSLSHYISANKGVQQIDTVSLPLLFSLRHSRITVTLQGQDMQVDLLSRHDTIVQRVVSVTDKGLLQYQDHRVDKTEALIKGTNETIASYLVKLTGLSPQIQPVPADNTKLVAILISVFSLCLAILVYRRSVKSNINTETQKVYDQWFSADWFKLRNTYKSLQPQIRAMNKERGWPTKTDEEKETERKQTTKKKDYFKYKNDELKKRKVFNKNYLKDRLHPDSYQTIMEIVYFFDKVGWLAARGHVNIEFFIGPMHHSVQTYWEDLEPLIVHLRKKNIHSLGFEYLYDYTRINSHEKVLKSLYPDGWNVVVVEKGERERDDKAWIENRIGEESKIKRRWNKIKLKLRV